VRRGPLFIPSVEHAGLRVRVVRNRCYHRPLAETFHEFAIRLLVMELGPGWLAAQRRRAAARRHVLCRWIDEWDRVRTSLPGPNAHMAADGRIGIEPTGALQALICLAYDVAAAIAASPTRPRRTIARLRRGDTFQGARYELAVARILATAGYDLEWQEDEQRIRHPEFVARCKSDGFAIGIEAKSRRRRGVLDSSEGPDPDREELRIHSQLKDALTQRAQGLPFAVFIDSNLPFPGRDRYADQRWRIELQNVVGRLRSRGTPASPHDFSLLIVTNFSWHYAGNQIADFADPPLFVLPTHAIDVLDTPRFLRLLDATNSYPVIPDAL